MNRIAVRPSFHFFSRSAEVLEERPVEKLNLAGGVHGAYQSRNAVHNLAEVVFSFCEFFRALRNPPIKFACDTLLLAQESRFLQSDHSLIRSHALHKSLGLPREIRPLRPCHEDPN